MKEKSLGQELISAIKDALKNSSHGKTVRPEIDIITLRAKLGLTQQEFAQQYHVKLQTLRNWEQKKRYPDTTTLAYLMCIAKRPVLIKNILNTYK